MQDVFCSFSQLAETAAALLRGTTRRSINEPVVVTTSSNSVARVRANLPSTTSVVHQSTSKVLVARVRTNDPTVAIQASIFAVARVPTNESTVANARIFAVARSDANNTFQVRPVTCANPLTAIKVVVVAEISSIFPIAFGSAGWVLGVLGLLE
jgi:hypothetical protein